MQTDVEFDRFLSSYIDQAKKVCFVIGGAGFDPRSTVLARRLKQLSVASVRGVFFREERELPQDRLRRLADKNQETLLSLIKSAEFPEIRVFAEGTTPIGGREVVKYINTCQIDDASDIFVDISALSTAVFFPLVRFLLERRYADRKTNIHLFAAEKAVIDHNIRGVPCDSVSLVHGFRGAESINPDSTNALLWLPTLAPGNGAILEMVHRYLSKPATPIDVCPIVPFPGHDPRSPDNLIFEYRELLVNWNTDCRNLLYAAESDALDAYRTICSIHDSRSRIFAGLGGSTIVLTPIGNKMLAVGAMLAAIENGLQVAIVESLGYDENCVFDPGESVSSPAFKHLWLSGEDCEES